MFMSRQFRVPPQLTDTLTTTYGTTRILFSFVVNKEGNTDNLVFHECSDSSLEKEIRRCLSRPENHWQPAMHGGQSITSAPVYFGIFITSHEVEKDPAKMNEQKAFFRTYPYKSLPNWQKSSVIIDPMQVVVFPTIRCYRGTASSGAQ